MYQKFDSTVAKVMATITSESHKRANRHYFALFKEHLIRNAIPYSHRTALEWLSANENVWTRRKYICCRTAIYKLDDILTNGAVASIGHYPFDNAPKYVKLSEQSRELLNSALIKTTYRGSSKNNFRIAVAEFLFFLEERGVKSVTEISAEHFAFYLHYMKETRNNRASYKNYICYVGTFLSEILTSSDTLCALIKRPDISSVVLLDDLPNDQKNKFIKAINAGKLDSMPVDDFYEAVLQEDKFLLSCGYTDGTRRQYSNFWKSLSFFLLLNRLDYSPQTAKCWAEHCGRKPLAHPRLTGGNIIYSHSKENEQRKLTYGQRSMSFLPKWSRELLEKYILDEQRRGQEQSSLETQRYACIKFLGFLERRGIASCKNITPEVLKEFNLSDLHLTPEGKKGYNSRIGRFLEFLGEQGLVPKTLRLALPCKIAKKVTIIKTLNEAEVSLLFSAKEKAVSPIALRDAAITMIALRMGLRAGDIVNLKFCDISLKNRTISISQGKTGKPLILPMPIMVGNCIYRYLTQGRPKSGAEYIFLSHKAPYLKLTSSACADAVKRMLCGDVKSKKYGSRILRKTFASRMLKTGNSVDSIANLLGHDGNSTVMTYLSTDDEKMRMCVIPAGKVVKI